MAKRKLILFEPSYELNSKDGQKRMDSLGYVKNIEGEVDKLGRQSCKKYFQYMIEANPQSYSLFCN